MYERWGYLDLFPVKISNLKVDRTEILRFCISSASKNCQAVSFVRKRPPAVLSARWWPCVIFVENGVAKSRKPGGIWPLAVCDLQSAQTECLCALQHEELPELRPRLLEYSGGEARGSSWGVGNAACPGASRPALQLSELGQCLVFRGLFQSSFWQAH